jgi:hypothetical protein
MIRFWQRMAAIYGHKWVSAFGDSPLNEEGKMTIAGDTWQRGLAGIADQSIATGLQNALMSADDWPPALPAFRAMCFDIPAFAEIRRHLTQGGVWTPFYALVMTYLDQFRWKRADQDKADKLLREAYNEAVAYRIAGNALPEPAIAIAAPVYVAPEQKPADPAKVAAEIAKLAEYLGKGA